VFLLRATQESLSKRAAANTIVPQLIDQFRAEFRQSPSPSEERSWKNSIPILLDQLMDAGLGKVEVLLEYQLPLYSGRADVVLVGQHPDGGPSCVVVENKQWTRLRSVDIKHRLVEVQGLNREMLHPQEQVRGYVEYLQDFNCYLGGHPGSLSGYAYLHNASSSQISDLRHPDLADLACFPISPPTR